MTPASGTSSPPVFAKIARVAREISYLRWQQVLWRTWYSAYKPAIGLKPAPSLRAHADSWIKPPARPTTLVREETFRFLNREGAARIPQDWNDPSREKLWLFNLHYFDDLNAENEQDRRLWHENLLKRWMAQNPPGTGHGWHPYPTSLRIVNWIKWFLSGNTAPNDLLNSLASQARWLRNRVEYHLPGNHLLSNAKALVFVGIFFEGKAADGWRLKGVQLFDRGSGEQILGDGGHFELSPMYHLTVLEDVLDLINLHRTYKFPVPERWLLVAERMLHWASVMRHPDGEIPFFNDAALEIAPTPKAVMGYAQQLGFNWFPIREEREIKLLKDSGFAKLQNASCVAFIDVAPVGPDHLAGHAHADTLSIEVSIGAQRVFVNSGTSLYAPGDERHRQRSTAAHNTVEIDGENSSEVWADFRLARRARPKDIQTVPAAMSISAWHDGYCRLRGKPRHHRSLTLLDSVLRVHDRVSGTGVHECAGRFHLHPEISVSRLEQEEGRFRATISFKDKSQPGVELIIQGPVSVSVEETSFHPEFGLNIPNQCIVFRYKGSLPCEVITELRW